MDLCQEFTKTLNVPIKKQLRTRNFFLNLPERNFLKVRFKQENREKKVVFFLATQGKSVILNKAFNSF